jgi:hypothetical protein
MIRTNPHQKVRPGTISRLAFCFVVCLLLSANAQAGNGTTGSDTTKQKYALNDPRNPDCPCHKLQKQAEDEYKALQKKNTQQVTSPVNQAIVRQSEKKTAGTSETVASSSHHFEARHKFSNWLFRYRWKHEGRSKRWKLFHPDYSICVQWN